jgi:FtsP/CotA-like multicopper oxidase with cupredoxin domain
MARNFLYKTKGGKNHYEIGIWQIQQQTGLIDPTTGTPLTTTVWGYGIEGKASWPGRTFEVQSGEPITVRWTNELFAKGKPLPHLLPVDTSHHWA